MSDDNYIHSFLTEAETIAVCLTISWIDRFFELDTDLFPALYSRVVKLEESDRWIQARQICETVITHLDPRHEDFEMAKINYFFCRQQMGEQGSVLLQEISELETSSIDAEIGKNCLLRNYSTLSQILRERLVGPGSPAKKMYLRESPLIRRTIKESTEVQRAFGVIGSKKKGK